MTTKPDSLELRINALEKAETVSLDRVAELVEQLEQGQVPSAVTQAAAWFQVLNALSILTHASKHSHLDPADCGNERCPVNGEFDE